MHLELNFYMVLAQLVPFLVVMLVLNVLVFNPMLNILQERKRRAEGYATEAEALREEAEKTGRLIEEKLATARAEAATRRARLVQEATDEGERLIAAARAEADKEMAAFRERLARVQAEASAALKAQAGPMSVEIASRVLGRAIA